MTSGISSGVQAMAASQKQLDSLANNLANSSTTAYKRQTSFVHAMAANRRGGQGEEVRVENRTDFSQGDIRQTGNPLDLALDGDGFFAVEGPSGEVFTRNGQFQVDRSGSLQTLDGFPIAWEGLQGAIDSEGSPIAISEEGVVSQDDRELGRLRLVNFQRPEQLESVDGGFFEAPDDFTEVAHTLTVRQHSLEGSNVSPIQEMISMISVQRRFSGASNVLGMINETYRRLSRMQ
ncbi:MAG: flagellar basal-body rod protein FlgF [Planctomycetota bacterium]|jgi:flagellar basal-body rod protein FlgF